MRSAPYVPPYQQVFSPRTLPDGGEAAAGPIPDPRPASPVTEVPKAPLTSIDRREAIRTAQWEFYAITVKWAAVIGGCIFAAGFLWSCGQALALGIAAAISGYPIAY